MRVLVCGGRDFGNYQMLIDTLDKLNAEHTFSLLVHGAAAGADSLAGEWAFHRGVACASIPANWSAHGKSAGAIRNQQMLDLNPDLVVAFPGGRGTAHMIRIARKKGTKVIEL